MPSNNSEIEKRLWEAADELRANSKLRSSEYSTPVLGLVFLKWADFKFSQMEKEFQKKISKGKRKRKIGKADYQAKGVMYLPKESRFSYLMKLPEKSDIGKAINDAMKAIENENEDLRGVLPTTFHRFGNRVLFSLLRIFNSIPMDVEGDVFGKVYEYFLGKFAMAEGQKGGEFFTPTSIVRLIVEILEPFHGRIYDPACGSGGMFVQSAQFVQEHMKNPSEEISIYGQERVSETVRLCRMNLAVHGLAGDIREGNTYYDDIHDSVGKYDFVMANPPFNVDRVDKERMKDDPRFSFGLPTADNANYIWIQAFYSALSERGRAGFVMANSATDAGGSELEIRKKILSSNAVDAIISLTSNLFYTVTLPCTLWFFDLSKIDSARRNQVLFIDARNIYNQVDRAHRELTDSQLAFLTNIVRIFRNEEPELDELLETNSTSYESLSYWKQCFPDNKYHDVRGLCKVATLDLIREEGWTLNPGRYVGYLLDEQDDVDFAQNFQKISEELKSLTKKSHELEKKLQKFTQEILDNL
jgi:type I restriction enzyme M protein